MGPIRPEAILAFNTQVENAIKETAGTEVNVLVSLVKFNDQVKVVLENVDLEKIEPLTGHNYQPSGWTAMYDGVGRAISLVLDHPEYKKDDSSVLMTIISDGQENHSKVFSPTTIKPLIKALNSSGKWTIVYEGANQDLEKVVDTVGFSSENTLNFKSTVDGMNQSQVLRSLGTKNYYGDVVEASAAGVSFSTTDFMKGVETKS